MKRAFTLLELLVATMLLAMLVTILTMIFNQSSIAWTIGIASVAGLNDTREKMSQYAGESENLIFSDNQSDMLKVASVWDDNGTGLRTDNPRTLTKNFEALSIPYSKYIEPLVDNVLAIGSSEVAGRDTYLVGVTSYGPDGKAGTWDDITTMPEEIVK